MLPRGLHHTRPPCPSPSCRVGPDSCPLIGDAIQPCYTLLPASPFAFSLSQHQSLFQHQVFSSESALQIRWPKYWSFSFYNSPSNDYSGLISFKIDWFNFVIICLFNGGPPSGWTSLVAQTVKYLLAMWKNRVQSLGREDPLEKEMAIHSSTIAWKIPWTEEPGRLQSMG